jgi:hypothetical protein
LTAFTFFSGFANFCFWKVLSRVFILTQIASELGCLLPRKDKN